MTAAELTDDQRRAVENVVYGHLLNASAKASGWNDKGFCAFYARPILATRVADARTVADLAGLDLALPHFAPLVAVIEQAIALPDRPEVAS